LRVSWLSFLSICLLLALSPAAANAREPFFPGAGSRAYDVKGYDLAIGYSRSGRIKATTRVTLVPRRQLAEVSLDFRGPRVERVSVGPPARFRRRGGKLILIPSDPIPKGELTTVAVAYAGVPPTIVDPDGTQEGWVRTDDGALAVGEPQGAAAWFPCNNVPWDKARFRVSISVPPGLKAISNGHLRNVSRRTRQHAEVSYSWHEPSPMSPYLAVLDIGRGKLEKQVVDGRPYWTLMDPRLATGSRGVVESLPGVIAFEARLFGGYPFEAAGSIVDFAPGLGYALESQSRPIYAFVPDLTTLVHETAHQWFGDSVGLKRWPNIWLNEGIATWTEWYYAERHGRRSAQEIFKRLYRVPASNEGFWNPPSGHPGTPAHMFGPSVYVRGAMALQALRVKIGTRPFLRILKAWATAHRYGSADIGEFIALAEEASGRDLGRFFHRWLYARGKPGGSGVRERPAPKAAPAKAKIGRVTVGSTVDGRLSALVAIRYPIRLTGQRSQVTVALRNGEGQMVQRWDLRDRLSSGHLRRPERRRSFVFVHRVDFGGKLERALGEGGTIRVVTPGDRLIGRPDLGPRRQRLCSSLPHLHLEPGHRTSAPLPACTSPRHWRIVRQPQHGSAQLQEGRLVYRADPGFRGPDSLQLSGGSEARFTVGGDPEAVVRALGDSVTAGFGYYSNGTEMGIKQLDGCRPAAKQFNDACSSNSALTESVEGPVDYSSDYGLSNNVSWAAQWANSYGVTNYKNLAVTGSEPGNWAPEGFLYEKTKQIEAEDPDYILLTLGANPLLSNMLFGLRDMECGAFDELPEFEECVKREFAKVGLREDLKAVYSDLLAKTKATIFVMQYHLSVPWSALAYSSTEIAAMGKLLNGEIASLTADLGNARLQVVTPPHFNVGIDISPVYPSDYTCRLYPVDGPSVQSTGTQDELEGHALSFCSGPAGGGKPWVVNGDTGIHPSATGYTQMASQVPTPG
jgi:Peptidase family M1 domain/Peptidase M1 N-terminal domain